MAFAIALTSALTALVALITINAVVDVARNIVVLEVGRVVISMATGALKHRVVIGIGMAG